MHFDVTAACSPSGSRAAVDFVDGTPRHIRCDDGYIAVREFSLGADLNQDSRRPFSFFASGVRPGRLSGQVIDPLVPIPRQDN